MKKWLTLCLVLLMLVGVSASAWASELIDVTKIESGGSVCNNLSTGGTSSNATITVNDYLKVQNSTIRITGKIPTGETGSELNHPYTKYILKQDNQELTVSNSGVFQITDDSTTLTGPIKLELYKYTVTYTENNGLTQSGQTLIHTMTISFPKIATPLPSPLPGTTTVTLTCTNGHTITVKKTDNDYYAELDDTCNSNHSITVGVTNNSLATGLTIAPFVDRFTSNSITTNRDLAIGIAVKNQAGESDTPSFIYVSRKAPTLENNTGLGNPTLTRGSTNISRSGTTFTIPATLNTTTDFTLAVSAASQKAKIIAITLNGNAVSFTQGSSVSCTLRVDQNITATNGLPLVITVQPEDTGKPTQSHTYYIKREATATIPTNLNTLTAQANNSSGSHLSINQTFDKDSNNNNYTFTVPVGTNSVYISWTKNNNAQVQVSTSNNNISLTGSTSYSANNTATTVNFPASIAAGQSATFQIQVRPGSSGTIRTYNITLQRATNNSNNNLTSLVARSGSSSGSTLSISPTFDKDSNTNNYTFTVPTGTNSVYIGWGKNSSAQAQLSNLSGSISISGNNTVVNTLTSYNTGNTSAIISFPSSITAGNSASFRINVRYGDSGTVRTYTITLQREGGTSTVSQLSSLYIKDRETSNTSSSYVLDMNNSFSSSRYSYTMSVPYDQEYIWVYPTTRTTGATINFSGGRSHTTDWSSSSNSGFYKVRLDTGTNKITLTVRSSGYTSTYTIEVTRANDVVRSASLSSLYVSRSSSSTSSGSRYSLSPSFQYNITSYSASVPKDRSEAYIHFEPYNSSSTVSVSNATKVSDNVYRVSLSGNNTRTVSIEVRNGSNRTTYEVKLNRGSSTALLSGLVVSSEQNTSSSYTYSLQPRFSSSTNNYLAIIPYSSSKSLSEFYVQATLDNSNDSLRVNGSSTSSGNWRSFNIGYGDTYTMDIEVKDSDDTNTYKLTVYAVPRNADNTATLRDLDIRTGSGSSSSIDLNTDFSSNTTSYTASVKNDVDSVRVYPTATDRNALILVNGEYVSDSYLTVDLEEGNNTITVQVIAEDGRTTRSYTVRITRSNTGSTNSALSGLEVRTASTQLSLSTVPGFNANTTTYTVNVPDDVTAINFRPTTSDSSATIRIQGSTERSGSWTGDYAVNSGNSNVFSITVTASNGGSTTYTINVVRGLAISVSNQSLRVNGTSVTSAAYNINSNNYFKLRDVAYALQGTSKNINVTYNDYTRVVSIVTGQNYVPIGGEMVSLSSYRNARLSNQTVTLDGRVVSIPAYNIDGNNYFMLRDIGELLDCGVDYDTNSRTIMIDTSKRYTYSAD